MVIFQPDMFSFRGDLRPKSASKITVSNAVCEVSFSPRLGTICGLLDRMPQKKTQGRLESSGYFKITGIVLLMVHWQGRFSKLPINFGSIMCVYFIV